MNDEDFDISETNLRIVCPKCGNEMAHDPHSLLLAESPRDAAMECGACAEISQWKYSLETLEVEQVTPVQYGGSF